MGLPVAFEEENRGKCQTSFDSGFIKFFIICGHLHIPYAFEKHSPAYRT